MDSDTTRLGAVAGSVETAYRSAFALLAEVGLGPADVVHVAEYATAGALGARDRVEAVRRGEMGERRVPVATIPVEGLMEPAAELAVELTAHPGGGRAVGELRIADGIVYLPGIHPDDAAHGDFRAQYRSCLEQAGDLLKAAGLGLDALVQTIDHTATSTRAEYPRCGRPRRELLGGTGTDGRAVHPGAAGILADRPVRPGAMVSLDALASTEPLRAVNPGWRRYDTLTYTPGVLAGKTLFMSGFGALEPATQRAVFEGDLLAQAEFVYAGIAAVLREAGLGDDLPYGCVERLVEYVTPAGVERYPEVAEIRRRYFGDGPALTSVVCSALLRPEFLIEVVPTAVLP
ncbi:RidA family protein [Actinomadura barringtoniae]|uniref:RidA family protein n=1 Tax=Actinomadura barringtoniae TaxID=1427535 RepID=A0A939T645_9ACTN|nr:RidA family protein [Actinomadura barringtoniae]MBO2447847.1 RidA family protein [Actinomadura barringtoniae]